MQIRFVAYDRLGAERGVIPRFLQAVPLLEENQLPTLTIHYPRDEPTSSLLTNQPELAMEYYVNGEWVEPKNSRWMLQSTDQDVLEEVPTKSFTFLGIGEALRGIHVFDDMGLELNEEGRVKFGTSTPGRIMNKVWTAAVARGWKGFSKSFTDTHDSNGVAWPQSINTSFAMETNGESVLSYLVRAGLCDYSWSGRTLNLYVNGGDHRELANITNAVRINLSGGPAGIDSGPEMTDREGMASHVVVLGEDGLRWTFPTGAILPEGRREVFLTFSGVDEEATARIFAEPTIVKYSNVVKNTTRQFHITDDTIIRPLYNYRVGDYLLVENDSGWERMRVFALSLQIDQNGIQGYISLGDKIDTLLERLNEKVQRNFGTVMTEGVAPPSASERKPRPPSGVTLSVDPFIDTNSKLQTALSVAFGHDNKDVNGSRVEIRTYHVQYRPTYNGALGWKTLGYITAPETSGTFAPLETYYRENLITYEIRVAAISTREVRSNWSTIVRVETRADTEPPTQPAAPRVTNHLGVFTVSTQHLTEAGNRQVPDYSHSVVQISDAPNNRPVTDVGVISPPDMSTPVSIDGYGTRWFRLVAVDHTGNRSEPSGWVESTSSPLVDMEVIIEELDFAETKIYNASKMLNLWPYNDFTDPLWAVGSPHTKHSNGGKYNGSSIVIAASPSQVGGYYGLNDQTVLPLIEPLTSYRMAVWVRPSAAAPIDSIRLYARHLSPDGTNQFVTVHGTQGNDTILPANTWSRVNTQFTTLDVLNGRLSIGVYVQPTLDAAVRFSDIELLPSASTDLIVPGAIYTRHLTVTADMTAALLKAKKVVAGEIDTNSLSADTAFIGLLKGKIIVSDVFSGKAFTGGTFTGATIRSAASGRRVQMTSAGLFAYDASGTITFQQNTSTGDISLRGAIWSQSLNGNSLWMGGNMSQSGAKAAPARPGIVFASDAEESLSAAVYRDGSYGALRIDSPYSNNTRHIGRSVILAANSGVFAYAWRSGQTQGPGVNNTEMLYLGTDGIWSIGGGAPGKLLDGRIWGDTANSTINIVRNTNHRLVLESDRSTYLNTSRLDITGPVYATAKNFRIPHPTRPGYDLIHGSTESPLAGVEYWGEAELNQEGEMIVWLPEYFEALTKAENRAILVTPKSEVDLLSVGDIVDGSFMVQGTPHQRFTWLVKAERKDADFDEVVESREAPDPELEIPSPEVPNLDEPEFPQDPIPGIDDALVEESIPGL